MNQKADYIKAKFLIKTGCDVKTKRRLIKNQRSNEWKAKVKHLTRCEILNFVVFLLKLIQIASMGQWYGTAHWCRLFSVFHFDRGEIVLVTNDMHLLTAAVQIEIVVLNMEFMLVVDG